MPVMHFRIRWPDGVEANCYSPSTVVGEYFAAGESYAVGDFVASYVPTPADFARLDERSPGVGLGLAVAKGFAEAMGGTIVAIDTPGGGLTVRVTLPALVSGVRAALGAGQ